MSINMIIETRQKTSKAYNLALILIQITIRHLSTLSALWLIL